MKDRRSLLCGVLIVVIVALARFTPEALSNVITWKP